MAFQLQSGAWAAAIRTPGGWALKPVCPPQEQKPALAVRAGGGWALAPYGQAKDGAYLALHTGGQRALLPLSCPEEGGGEEPCAGSDPRCPICDCAAGLAASYLVSISGFPAVCGAGAFNGTWTLRWVSECVWECDIDAWNRLRLYGQEGPFWQVLWAGGGLGGLSGSFGGIGENPCAPEQLFYYYWDHYDAAGCAGLMEGLMTATVAVARGGAA